jgi:ATP-dependent Zn protease
MLVDRSVKELLGDAEKQAVDLIAQHRELLNKLITELEQHETLNREQVKACTGEKVLELNTR